MLRLAEARTSDPRLPGSQRLSTRPAARHKIIDREIDRRLLAAAVDPDQGASGDRTRSTSAGNRKALISTIAAADESRTGRLARRPVTRWAGPIGASFNIASERSTAITVAKRSASRLEYVPMPLPTSTARPTGASIVPSPRKSASITTAVRCGEVRVCHSSARPRSSSSTCSRSSPVHPSASSPAARRVAMRIGWSGPPAPEDR